MRMNRIAALTLGAGMITMAACSDSPTAPTAAAVKMPTTSFAIGDITNGPAPEAAPGVIIVCKTGDVGGSFDFNRTTEGPAVDPTGGVAADQSIDTGKCLEVARDNSPSGSGSHITITELAAQGVTFSITACRFRGYALDGVTLNPPEDCTYSNGGDLFLNHFHGFVITYNNVQETQGCTYTKGWYQNKNGEPTIIDGVDGRSKADQIKIFNASPGQPGDVTWGTNNKPNNLLNLYQQLLAALNNVGNNVASAPPSVQTAINNALAATTAGPGTYIGLVGNPDIGALITPLSNFNEGLVAGWPHCD